MTCRDVHPGDKVHIESFASLDGVPRDVTVKFMAEHYWMPDEKNKLSYNVIKYVIKPLHGCQICTRLCDFTDDPRLCPYYNTYKLLK